jgi:hypothetical protein
MVLFKMLDFLGAKLRRKRGGKRKNWRLPRKKRW